MYLAVAAAAAAVLVVLLFRAVSAEATYPFERAWLLLRRGVFSRVAGCFRGAEAQAENVRLRREVAALSLVRGDCEILERENARLRSALAYRERSPESWLAAAVLSQGGGAAGAGSTIRVDRGSLDGVLEGAVVAVPEGLVGRVTEVSPHTATVTLITDPSVGVHCEVEVSGAVRPRGILSGGTGDILVIRHLSNGARALVRSRVLTSGLGGVFPKGLEIGTFLAVRTDGGELAREGEVQPGVDFATLEDVFIRREK